jgi:hypothetical protein
VYKQIYAFIQTSLVLTSSAPVKSTPVTVTVNGTVSFTQYQGNGVGSGGEYAWRQVTNLRRIVFTH